MEMGSFRSYFRGDGQKVNPSSCLERFIESELKVKTGCGFKQGAQLVGIDACELLHLGASEFLGGELKEFHTVEVRTFAIGDSALVGFAKPLKVKGDGFVVANNGFGT